MDKYFYVLLVLALFVLVSALVRWQQKSWITPSSVFILFWTALTAVSVIMAPDFYFSPIALLFILSLILAFYVGGIFVKPSWISRIKTKPGVQQEHAGDILARFFLGYLIPATLIGFLAVLLLLRFYQFSFDFLSPKGMTDMTNMMTSDRYQGLSLPRPVMICLAVAYSGSLAGGYVFIYSKNLYHRLLTFLPFLPVLVFTLIYTARAPLLYQAILFLSSMLSTAIALKGPHIVLFSRRFILLGSVGTVFILLVFLVTQMTRMEAGFNNEQVLATYMHLRSWFFGNLSGFSVWFDQVNFSDAPVWGSYSLGGLFEMTGISTRKVGLYDTYVAISAKGDQTNIFTLFRLLIDDYSIFSVHLLMLILGFLARYFYYALLAGKWIFLPLLSAVFALIFWSFIASFFTYNTNILAFIIFGLLIIAVLTIKPLSSGE
ncbi:MAG: O-antigen polymerase [Bacteroidales bacterium]